AMGALAGLAKGAIRGGETRRADVAVAVIAAATAVIAASVVAVVGVNAAACPAGAGLTARAAAGGAPFTAGPSAAPFGCVTVAPSTGSSVAARAALSTGRAGPVVAGAADAIVIAATATRARVRRSVSDAPCVDVSA